MLSLTADQGTIILTARTGGDTAQCPIWGQPSTRVHSRYRRTLADLPWQEFPARLMRSLPVVTALLLGPTQLPTTHLHRAITRYRGPARTAHGPPVRLAAAHRLRGTRGEPGARLLRHLGVTLDGDTLLACIRAALSPALPTPDLLSPAKRGRLRFASRGRTYGSISWTMVDREASRERMRTAMHERFAVIQRLAHEGMSISCERY